MKRAITLLPVLLLASCYPTRIVTVTPYSGSAETYYTTVSTPRTNTVTSTTQVYASSHDISLDLDLQAVAAAFGQASNVREFEYLLNNSSYMITNLDLNRDGFVDYLRVVETVEGYNHLFVIQAVLGDNIFQDVATVVVENPHLASFHVEIIGAPFIYGPSFFIRPVFHAKPCIFAHLCMREYHPWMSPWYWGHYPPCYRRPEPVYLSHYQAYVDTYMCNSRYCHKVEYPQVCHYSRYDAMTRDLQRNDYGAQHPERSFTTRTANVPEYGTSALDRSEQASRRQNTDRPFNAQNIRENQSTRSTSVTQSKSSGQTAPARNAETSSPSRNTGTVGGSTAQPGRSSSQTRNGSISSQTRSGSTSSGPGNVSGSTTVDSRVKSSGSSNTSTRTVSPSGSSTTVRRGSTAGNTRSSGSTSSSGSTRSGSATTGSSSTRSGSATTGSSSRSGSASSNGTSARNSSTSSSSRTSGGTGSARR